MTNEELEILKEKRRARVDTWGIVIAGLTALWMLVVFVILSVLVARH